MRVEGVGVTAGRVDDERFDLPLAGRDLCSAFGVQYLGLKIWSLRLRVWDLGFGVEVLESRVWGLGSGVWSLGFGV